MLRGMHVVHRRQLGGGSDSKMRAYALEQPHAHYAPECAGHRDVQVGQDRLRGEVSDSFGKRRTEGQRDASRDGKDAANGGPSA